MEKSKTGGISSFINRFSERLADTFTSLIFFMMLQFQHSRGLNICSWNTARYYILQWNENTTVLWKVLLDVAGLQGFPLSKTVVKNVQCMLNKKEKNDKTILIMTKINIKWRWICNSINTNGALFAASRQTHISSPSITAEVGNIHNTEQHFRRNFKHFQASVSTTFKH